MNSSFEYITTLEYRLRAANAELEAFRSGKKYIHMEELRLKEVRALERRVKELEKELGKAHAHAISIRNQWFEIFESLQKECDKKVAEALKEKELMEARALKAEAQRDAALDKVKVLRQKNYEVESSLEEEKGKVQKLTAQLNRDYENSSLPSSMTIKKKKISNSREATGRRPGGQPGHKGHGRRKQEPTEVVLLPPPQEVQDDPDFKKTKKTIVKQVIGIRVSLNVTEYRADVYYNSKTGERRHAKFPTCAKNDVNYDGSIKSFLYLLNNDCCVSIDKTSRFLYDLTGGKLKISKGMINGLAKKFSQKTKQERDELIARILSAPVTHTDFTNARINGENAYVLVCATPAGELAFYSCDKKGHEGIKGTLIEDYQGILVHDHDITFYKYGANHQECLAHILRYLKDSIENEPDRTWNVQMRELIQEMIHYRNRLPEGAEVNEHEVAVYEERYRAILQKAKEEYEYIPASDYYKDGYNLYQRMDKYMENHLLFLHDMRVPTSNNEAERDLRKYKRKQKQAVSFRSKENHKYLCDCMSLLIMMRKNNDNIYDRVSMILD